MKFLLTFCLLTLGLIAVASAASFDSAGFGAKLNGWDKSGKAVYELSDTTYTTHKPMVSTGAGGGMFVSARLDVLAHAGKGAVCHLSLNFNSAGALQSIQIKAQVHGRAIDTAVVRREDQTAELVQSADEEGGGEPVAKPVQKLNPTEAMVAEVIRRFDLEMKKMVKNTPPVRKDLFSRLSKQQVETADLSGGLRHNINLMLACVRAR